MAERKVYTAEFMLFGCPAGAAPGEDGRAGGGRAGHRALNFNGVAAAAPATGRAGVYETWVACADARGRGDQAAQAGTRDYATGARHPQKGDGEEPSARGIIFQPTRLDNGMLRPAEGSFSSPRSPGEIRLHRTRAPQLRGGAALLGDAGLT